MGHIDLNAAAVLVQVVKSGSFRGAARVLDMPKTTVSRKVAELEERLGAQLLHRTTRTLALTDAGAVFVERVGAALAELEAAEVAVSELQREPRGRLRVSTTVPLGQAFLMPVIAEFLGAFPSVQVTLQLTDRHVDLVAERVDVALRTGALPDSSLVAHTVGRSAMLLVASPHYLRQRGTPSQLAELAEHDCVVGLAPGGEPRSTWPLGRGKQVRDVAITGRFASGDLLVLRQAAERGLGIARLPAPIVREAIADGALVPVLQDYVDTPVVMHLVHLGGRYVTPGTRAFIDFVRPRLAHYLERGGAA